MSHALSGLRQASTLGRCWGATADEVQAGYPCDNLLAGHVLSLHRAVTIAAPAELVYRWICQLRVAPYSYDLLDNLGRRSPRAPTPGSEDLEVGQRWMVFRIVGFEPGRHVTGVVLPRARRVFGPMACSYVVRPQDSGCRLVVRLNIAATTGIRRVLPEALAWGDLVMMRKQLLTIKQLAEEQAAATT